MDRFTSYEPGCISVLPAWKVNGMSAFSTCAEALPATAARAAVTIMQFVIKLFIVSPSFLRLALHWIAVPSTRPINALVGPAAKSLIRGVAGLGLEPFGSCR